MIKSVAVIYEVAFLNLMYSIRGGGGAQRPGNVFRSNVKICKSSSDTIFHICKKQNFQSREEGLQLSDAFYLARHAWHTLPTMGSRTAYANGFSSKTMVPRSIGFAATKPFPFVWVAVSRMRLADAILRRYQVP